MTNKKQRMTALTLATILIAGSFSLTPFAYSTGWNDDDDDDDDHSNQIPKGLCDDTNNLLANGCFEMPVVTNSKKWDVYNTVPGWTVNWLIDDNNDATDGINPCQPGEPGFTVAGYLELQKGILGGPSEGVQHAELDSDCNGPTNNARSGEKSSVGISQPMTTSEINDYQITFAYKARPDQPLSTNGLMVSWNGDDITPNNLDFSKKKWKYASMIVGVDAAQDLSTLVFEDTGNPDSFGTFLDDVSVKAIPKPVIKITLKKEIVNSQGGTITDPNAFGLKINGAGVSHDIENIYTTAGTFTINEDGAPNYVGTLVASENCPFDSLGDATELELGGAVECTILNTFVPPPTITLKKVITQDNTDLDEEIDLNNELVDENPFHLIITNTVTDLEYEITTPNQAVPPGTYTLREETDEGFEYFEFVLITGDDDCPTMEDDMEEFTLSSGQHLTCVVFNDDDTDALPGGSLDGPGVIFHYDTISMVPNDILDDNHCNIVGAELPCIQKVGAGSKYMIFPDFATDNSNNALTQTSLILLTVLDTTNPLLTGDCRVTGVQELSQSFVAVCPGFDADNEMDSFNFNWAIIETSA
jgi:hypothetical protein